MCVSVNIGKIWGLDPILKPLPACDKYSNILLSFIMHKYIHIFVYIIFLIFICIKIFVSLKGIYRNLQEVVEYAKQNIEMHLATALIPTTATSIAFCNQNKIVLRLPTPGYLDYSLYPGCNIKRL